MYKNRLFEFREIMKSYKLEGFLISNFYNILYLTGFKTLVDNEREAWCFITSKNIYLFTDSRYVNNNNIDKTNLIFKLINYKKGLTKYLDEIIKEEKINKFGVESDDLKLFEYQKLKESLKAAEMYPLNGLIMGQRGIKDGQEIKLMEKSCKLADLCLKEITPLINLGITEKEIANKIDFWLKEKNHDMAFYPIVAIDKNSGTPHYDTKSGNNLRVKNGSIILIDFGVNYKNYLSDITRIFFVGKPKNEINNIYNQLLNIQEKTVSFISKAAKYKEVDNFCRKQLQSAGLPNYSHSTGHGVGLNIHEYPKVSILSEEKILPNQIITIEPGIYFENKWGMRIEDTILIKKNGVKTLTNFSKKPLIIG